MTKEPDRDEVPTKKPTNEMWEPSWSRGGLGGYRQMTEADGMVFAGCFLLAGLVGFGWLIWKVVFQG